MEKRSHAGAYCPACQRFIGPATTCPYCECPADKPLSLKLLRLAAVLVGIGGLALLYVAGIRREIPRVRIETITPTMNFAYVRIAGTTPEDARVYRDGTVPYSVSFPVADGTGRILVRAYDACARELVSNNRLPCKGAAVEVAGSISVMDSGRRRIYLETPEHLKISAPATEQRSRKEAAEEPDD